MLHSVDTNTLLSAAQQTASELTHPVKRSEKTVALRFAVVTWSKSHDLGHQSLVERQIPANTDTSSETPERM